METRRQQSAYVRWPVQQEDTLTDNANSITVLSTPNAEQLVRKALRSASEPRVAVGCSKNQLSNALILLRPRNRARKSSV